MGSVINFLVISKISCGRVALTNTTYKDTQEYLLLNSECMKKNNEFDKITKINSHLAVWREVAVDIIDLLLES